MNRIIRIVTLTFKYTLSGSEKNNNRKDDTLLDMEYDNRTTVLPTKRSCCSINLVYSDSLFKDDLSRQFEQSVRAV